MRVRERIWAALLVGAHAVPSTGWSQATKDQSRLIFTVSAGAVLGSDLWEVAAQPVEGRVDRQRRTHSLHDGDGSAHTSIIPGGPRGRR